MELLGLISAPVSIIAFITRPQDESGFSNIDRRLIAAYGKIPALIIKFGLPETFESLIDVDKVARGSDLTALAFKNSYVFDCSMTIVAVRSLTEILRGPIELRLTRPGLYHCPSSYHCAFFTVSKPSALGCTRIFHCKPDRCCLFGVLCCHPTTKDRPTLRSSRYQKLDFSHR